MTEDTELIKESLPRMADLIIPDAKARDEYIRRMVREEIIKVLTEYGLIKPKEEAN